MARMLRNNFNNDRGSDITVALKDGRKLCCHKQVLSMGSSVLRTMFRCGMRETTASEISLYGEPNAMELMLQFLYTGHCDLNDNNIAAVTKVADMFDVQDLHMFCLKYINGHIKVHNDNGAQLLRGGFEHKVDAVFAAAAHEVITGRLWIDVDEMTYPLIEAMVNLARLHCETHMNVVRVIRRWMNSGFPSRREDGIALLMRVEFDSLSFSELAAVCSMEVVQNTPRLRLAVLKAMSIKNERPSFRARQRWGSRSPGVRLCRLQV